MEQAQLAQGRVETVELGVADDRVDAGRAEPGVVAIFRIETPSACAVAIAHVRSSLAISRRHVAWRTRASNRDSRCHARRHWLAADRSACHSDRIAPTADGAFAKANAL